MHEITIFEFPLNVKEEPAQAVVNLSVSLTFKETGISETICFKDYSVFEWIENEVFVNKWKITSSLEDEIEIITEGANLESLKKFISDNNFEFK